MQPHPEYDFHEIARIADSRRRALIREGFFACNEDVDRLVADFERLHNDPKAGDVAWRHGIDPDLLDPAKRHLEIRNWLDHCVLGKASYAA